LTNHPSALAELTATGDTDPPEARASVTIVVCSSCRRPGDPEDVPRPGSLLARRTAAADARGIRVRQVVCLGNCQRGLSAAILRDGCWSYVFGDLRPESAGDLIAGAQLFAASRDGFMPFAARPESLKRGLIARVPNFESLKDIP
jgi:predicted metal-binding protein